MKIAPFRVFSLVALCAALAGGCESDYDKLSEDLEESGWGEDAGGGLPTCVPGPMDASSGGSADAGSSADAGNGDAASGDAGSNGDGATNGGDGAANGDSSAADGETPGNGDSDVPDA